VVMLVVQLVEGRVGASVVVRGRDARVGVSELGSLLAQCSIACTYIACILGVLSSELDLGMPHIIPLVRAEQQVALSAGSWWFLAASGGSCIYGTNQGW
jgi:hypothetical protein